MSRDWVGATWFVALALGVALGLQSAPRCVSAQSISELRSVIPVDTSDAVVRVSWQGCDSLVENRSVGAGAGKITAVVSVIGQKEPHRGYEVWMRLVPPSGVLPDAWRFDRGHGCHGPSSIEVTSDVPRPQAARCPAFRGGRALPLVSFDYDAATGEGRLAMAVTYDDVQHVDPKTRYHLWTIVFDQSSASVGPSDPKAATCGGVELPICFRIYRAKWLTTLSQEVAWRFENQSIAVNSPDRSVCRKPAAALPDRPLAPSSH